jgi:hypothetical protein
LLAVLAVLPPAIARADPLTACKDHYVAARFEATRRCIERALPELTEQPAALCDAYAFLAAAQLADEDEDAARRAMDTALAIDPTYDPVDPILSAPRVRDLLAAARPSGRTGRPVVLPAEPDQEGESVLVFSARTPDVHDPLSLRLRYRFGTRSWRESLLHESSVARGTRVVAVPRPEGTRRVEYLFSLETPERAIVARVGTEDAPLALDLARRAVGPDPPPPGGGGGRNGDGGRTAWYERWYLWAGAAGVIAGTVVLVLLLQGDETGSLRLQLDAPADPE